MFRLGSAMLVGCLLAASPLAAAPQFVASYTMPNGSGTASGGTFNYWDVLYSAPGAPVTTDGAPLSGGTGKLTDNVTTTVPWYLNSNIAGTGPYVGWNAGTTPSLSIAFQILVPPCLCLGDFVIDKVTVWLDNSGVGGVSAPVAILLNGIPYGFTPPPAGTAGPVTLSGPALVNVFQPVLSFAYGNQWIFVSEVAIDGYYRVVEPAGLALLGIGLAGLIGARRRAA